MELVQASGPGRARDSEVKFGYHLRVVPSPGPAGGSRRGFVQPLSAPFGRLGLERSIMSRAMSRQDSVCGPAGGFDSLNPSRWGRGGPGPVYPSRWGPCPAPDSEEHWYTEGLDRFRGSARAETVPTHRIVTMTVKA
jgi:hypothetical protein